MKYLFQSKRLGFRKWTPADLTPMSALNADPAVMEFFRSTQTKEQTKALLARIEQEFEEFGHCWYAVDTLKDGDFIGFIGLAWNTQEELDFTPSAEIGWRLKKAAWGNGYATEGATRCLQYGFEDLKLSEIYSFTATINQRSERVMQKIGMTKIGEFGHPQIEEGHALHQHVLYHLSAK